MSRTQAQAARPLKPITHGTHSGFNLHRRRGESPCGACHAAERTYQNYFDQRGKCAKGIGWPLLSAREATHRG